MWNGLETLRWRKEWKGLKIDWVNLNVREIRTVNREMSVTWKKWLLKEGLVSVVEKSIKRGMVKCSGKECEM